jgi:hypothetical protein
VDLSKEYFINQISKALRLSYTEMIFTAKPPQNVGENKYDESAKAMMALLKYGAGMPFYRLERLQQNLGLPTPSLTQWDQLEQGADKIYLASKELERRAA